MNPTYFSDQTQLNFRDTGTGVPVVFLHPTPVDGRFWSPLVAKLDGIRAIVPDLRGHGASALGSRLPAGGFAPVPDAPVLSMGQLASDFLALLDYLKLSQAVFVGCSIGGSVLLELWRRAPERMRGLAFICAKPQPDAEMNLARRVTTIAQAREGKNGALFDAASQSLTAASARQRNPALAGELRAMMTLSSDAEVAVQAGLGARPDSVPTVASITVPVLAIAGGEDVSVSPAEMEAFRAAPGGCAYHILADAGHAAAYEQPDKVGGLMRVWLGQAKLVP